MGVCSICGEPCSWFKKMHSSCRARENQRVSAEQAAKRAQEEWATNEIKSLISHANDEPTQDLLAKLKPLTEVISAGALLRVVGDLTANLFARMKEDGPPPSYETEELICGVLDQASLSPSDIPGDGLKSLTKMCMIRDLQEGKIPRRFSVKAGFPFNFERGEEPVWGFQPIEYLKDEAVHQPYQTYGGVSVRIAPGIYSHLGASPRPSTQYGLVPADRGFLVVTNKSLWFQGEHRTLRIHFREIASLSRYTDGIVFCGGNQAARNQSFSCNQEDAWFLGYLVAALANPANSFV